jgi:hypothetical protein
MPIRIRVSMVQKDDFSPFRSLLHPREKESNTSRQSKNSLKINKETTSYTKIYLWTAS